jgi:hypothetical protein
LSGKFAEGDWGVKTLKGAKKPEGSSLLQQVSSKEEYVAEPKKKQTMDSHNMFSVLSKD